MRWLVVLLVACGGSQKPKPPPPDDHHPDGAAADTRTPIQKRRDAACEAIAPKLVQCAVDDATRDLEAGKITKQQFDTDTAEKWRNGLKSDWLTKCEVDMSSRQVRVLEVCFREEQECAPLVDCLHHLQDNVGK